MICVTICDFGYDACCHALKRVEKYLGTDPDIVAEIRLDLCGLTENETQLLFVKSRIPLIATFRRRSNNLFLPAMLGGAAYVDIDGIASDDKITDIINRITNPRTKKILSYQNYQKTPSLKELKAYYRNGVKHGADIIKIVTTAESFEDSERVLSLYRLRKEGELESDIPLVAYTMGYPGSYSGIEACACGAPLLYCSPDSKTRLYPGMPALNEMENLLTHQIKGDIHIPGSKDMTQKAILASMLSVERSTIYGFSSCKDTDAALSLARRRAKSVELHDGVLSISGGGLHTGSHLKKKSEHRSAIPGMFLKGSMSQSVSDTNFVGESGLLARMCFPIVAQIGHQVTITGEGHLLDRTMYSCQDALEKFGANCVLTAEGTLPAIVNGPLEGGTVTISGRDGTQLISGLLMSLPLSRKDSTLRVENPTNLPYLLTTIDVLGHFGISLSYGMEENVLVFRIPGKQKYSATDIYIEGDWSSAANFVVAAAIFGELRLHNLSPVSPQADREIIEIVKKTGAEALWDNNILTVRRGHLNGFTFDVSHNPDLFPILSVLAAFCEGTSTITGLDHIQYRDSRRIETMCHALGKMGVDISPAQDRVDINGVCLSRRRISGALLHGGEYLTSGDHRVAMALKIAGIGAGSKVSLDDMDCVSKSYPSFKDTLHNITK